MNDDNIVLSYPLMARQREDKIKSNLVAYAEDVNAELDHMVDVHNQLVMMLNGEWSEDTGRIYQLMNQAITTANEAKAIADNCVKRSGDTMTGHLNSSLTPTSDYNLVNKAYVDDKVNTEVGSVEARVVLLEDFAENLEADQVKLDNTNFSSTNVHDGFSELFISVSNGKAIVAAAITGKGVETAADASFKTMADNINAILTFTEGTSGGTATNADIVYGKTAYARGQLLVGTLDISHAYDTSDATATPYDIKTGKVAYGATGRITGLLNINDEGRPEYVAGSVQPVYGYSDNYLYTNSTSMADDKMRCGFGVNKQTGMVDIFANIRTTTNATSSSQEIVALDLYDCYIDKNGKIHFANQYTLENFSDLLQTVDDTENPENNYDLGIRGMLVGCTDKPDTDTYLYIARQTKDADGYRNITVFVFKIKKVTVEDTGSEATQHYEIDTEHYWKYETLGYSYMTGFDNVSFCQVTNGEYFGKRFAALLDTDNTSSRKAGLFTLQLTDNLNKDGTTYQIMLKSNSNVRITAGYLSTSSGFSANTSSSGGDYANYDYRVFYITDDNKHLVFGTPNCGIASLTDDFTITGVATQSKFLFTGDDGEAKSVAGVITRDGKYLFSPEYVCKIPDNIIGESNLYLEKVSNTNLKTVLTNGYNDVLYFSPSGNMLVRLYTTGNDKISIGSGGLYGDNRYIYHLKYYKFDISNLESPLTLIGENDNFGAVKYAQGSAALNISSDGSLFIYYSKTSASSVSGDLFYNRIIRDYSTIIGLRYEGEYYYKAGYTGGLTPGGES